MKEEGSWRDLEIHESPKVRGWRPPSAPPLPGKSGGKRPLDPPCSYAYAPTAQSILCTNCPWEYSSCTNCSWQYSAPTVQYSASTAHVHGNILHQLSMGVRTLHQLSSTLPVGELSPLLGICLNGKLYVLANISYQLCRSTSPAHCPSGHVGVTKGPALIGREDCCCVKLNSRPLFLATLQFHCCLVGHMYLSPHSVHAGSLKYFWLDINVVASPCNRIKTQHYWHH